MSREEIQKLLGGYATDTLTADERRALFEAALEDQELFDALAKEQALRDLWEDRSARAQLMAALGPRARDSFAARAWRWVRQPAAVALAGVAAGVLIVSGIAMWRATHVPPREAVVAEAIPPKAPQREPAARDAAAPSTAGRPHALQPKAFRPPAVRAQTPAAPLPVPPVLNAPSDLTAARPAATGNDARLPVASPVMGFVGGAKAPVASGSLQKAKSLTAAAAYRPIQYTMLLKNDAGVYLAAPAGNAFHAADSVRVQVEPIEDGYVYLLRRQQTGGWSLIEGSSVVGGQRYEFPSAGGIESDAPGTVELLLVFSRAGLPDPVASFPHAPWSSRITVEYR